MPETIIKVALHKVTLNAIHIDDAENGLDCGCYCDVCGVDFQAVQSKSEHPRAWHYRHDGKGCGGGQETALHKFAKQILVEHNRLYIPGHGTVFYDEPVAEKQHLTVRPDVKAIHDGQQIFFEVAVKHFSEPQKRSLIKLEKLRTVEINLCELAVDATKEETIAAVLYNESNKEVIYWQQTEYTVNNGPANLLTLILAIIKRYPIIAVVVIFISLRFLLRRIRRIFNK
jgi:hypothetical protein